MYFPTTLVSKRIFFILYVWYPFLSIHCKSWSGIWLRTIKNDYLFPWKWFVHKMGFSTILSLTIVSIRLIFFFWTFCFRHYFVCRETCGLLLSYNPNGLFRLKRLGSSGPYRDEVNWSCACLWEELKDSRQVVPVIIGSHLLPLMT